MLLDVSVLLLLFTHIFSLWSSGSVSQVVDFHEIMNGWLSRSYWSI